MAKMSEQLLACGRAQGIAWLRKRLTTPEAVEAGAQEMYDKMTPSVWNHLAVVAQEEYGLIFRRALEAALKAAGGQNG